MAGQVGGVERRLLAHVAHESGDGAEQAGLGDADLQREQEAAAVGRDDLREVLGDEVLELLARHRGGEVGEGRVESGEADRQGLHDGGSREVDEGRLQGGDAGLGGAEQCSCVVQDSALQLVGLSSCALDLTGVLLKYNTTFIYISQ